MDKEFSPWRNKIHEIIFGADTGTGKIFDVTLLICGVKVKNSSRINPMYFILFVGWSLTPLRTIFMSGIGADFFLKYISSVLVAFRDILLA